MITPYVGEFLVNPIPLEIALHRCNYGCVYCFATLNYRYSQYTYQPAKLFRQLATMREKKSLTARLLQEGYPVLLSNHTDPFSPKNRDLAVTLISTLRAMNIPIVFQTKGGVPNDVLDAQPPSAWYISITTDNDDVRKRVEPGAPPIEDRLRLIRRLVERGHVVHVGMNPYVPEWWTDEVAALETWKALGVHGVWTELLHLHYRQRDFMTAREISALTPELINVAMKRIDPPALLAAWDNVRVEIAEAGLSPFSVGQGIQSDYFTPYADLYPKRFPVYQDFVNYCHVIDRDKLDFVTEKEFIDWFVPGLPSGRYNEVNSYLGATNHDLFWNLKIPNALTYKELLSIIWRNPNVRKSMANCGAFAFPVLKDAQGRDQWVCDKDGLPVLSFQASEQWENYVDMTDDEIAAWYWLKYPDDAPESVREDIRAAKARITQARMETIEELRQQN